MFFNRLTLVKSSCSLNFLTQLKIQFSRKVDNFNIFAAQQHIYKTLIFQLFPFGHLIHSFKRKLEQYNFNILTTLYETRENNSNFQLNCYNCYGPCCLKIRAKYRLINELFSVESVVSQIIWLLLIAVVKFQYVHIENALIITLLWNFILIWAFIVWTSYMRCSMKSN